MPRWVKRKVRKCGQASGSEMDSSLRSEWQKGITTLEACHSERSEESSQIYTLPCSSNLSF